MKNLNASEIATTLAALRVFQANRTKLNADNMEHFIEAAPLTNEQIDALCEELNFGDERPTAIYNAAANSLTCPHCKLEGLRNGIPATGEYGRGFKFVEDVPSYRSIAQLRNGTLIVDTDYQDNAEGASNYRLECRNCLAESALPEGLTFDFDGEDA